MKGAELKEFSLMNIYDNSFFGSLQGRGKTKKAKYENNQVLTFSSISPGPEGS
jgi:hypothetical protein